MYFFNLLVTRLGSGDTKIEWIWFLNLKIFLKQIILMYCARCNDGLMQINKPRSV